MGYIKKIIKYLMLLFVKIWVLGYLLVNGELNLVILFVSFLVYVVFDCIMVKCCGDNGLGVDIVLNLMMDLVLVVVGVVVWVVIVFWLYFILFGV